MHFLFSFLLFFYSFNLLSIELVRWKEGPDPAPMSSSDKNLLLYTNEDKGVTGYMTYPYPPLADLVETMLTAEELTFDCSAFKNNSINIFQEWRNKLPIQKDNDEKYLGTGKQIRHNSWLSSIFNGRLEDSRTEPHSPFDMPVKGTAFLLWDSDPKQLSTGSGFVVFPNVIVTAGHCVWDRDKNRWDPPSKVAVAANKMIFPFGFENIVQMFTTKVFRNTPENVKIPHADVGFIIVDRPIGLLSGTYAIAGFSRPLFIKNDNCYIGGYPGSLGYQEKELNSPEVKKKKTERNLTGNKIDGIYMGAGGTIQSIRNDVLQYAIDTSGGQSGTAVIATSPKIPDNNWRIAVGVHNSSGVQDENFNQGARFSPALIETLLSVVNTYGIREHNPFLLTRNSPQDWVNLLQYTARMDKEIVKKSWSSRIGSEYPFSSRNPYLNARPKYDELLYKTAKKLAPRHPQISTTLHIENYDLYENKGSGYYKAKSLIRSNPTQAVKIYSDLTEQSISLSPKFFSQYPEECKNTLYHLGILYAAGQGVPQNLNMAHQFLYSSYNHGNLSAEEVIKSIRKFYKFLKITRLTDTKILLKSIVIGVFGVPYVTFLGLKYLKKSLSSPSDNKLKSFSFDFFDSVVKIDYDLQNNYDLQDMRRNYIDRYKNYNHPDTLILILQQEMQKLLA